MVTLDKVSRQFSNQIIALMEVSFHIPAGEIVGIIGTSGAGKTTLLKLISGLLMPTSGTVRVLGLDPHEQRNKIGRYISVLSAKNGILRDNDTVETNLEMVKNVFRRKDQAFRHECDELCKRFGIQGYRQAKVQELSYGQKRRVELVCLFLQEVKLMVFDEPCDGLDAEGKKIFEEEIEKRRKIGNTILISSHNMGEIEKVCTRIILMNKGMVVFYGDQRRLLRKYTPIDAMKIRYKNGIPDLQDLPILKYIIEDQTITILYNTQHITAAEILQVLLESISIVELSVKKPSLEEAIAVSMGKGEMKDESLHSSGTGNERVQG
jgi:ABC-type multidrug transport system ATPase subunit